MGLVILGSEIESNCNTLKSYSESGLNAVNNMISGIENAVNATSLQGSAYNNLKMYLLSTYYPTCLRLKDGFNSLGPATEAVLGAFHASGINAGELLKEDELKTKISSLEANIASLTNSLGGLGFEDSEERASLTSQISQLRGTLAPLKTKLQKMYQFNSSGAGKFREAISSLQTASSVASHMSIPAGGDVAAYVSKMNLNVNPDLFPTIMNDIKHDISKYGRSVWEYHAQTDYLNTLIANGTYDITKYQEELAKDLEKAGLGTREAVVAAATFWATKFPRMQYFWGGKSNNSHNSDGTLGYNGVVAGINPDWGKDTIVAASDSKTTGKYVPLGMDCSGLVAWAIQTGGKNDKTNPLSLSAAQAQTQAELGEYVAFGDKDNGFKADKIKPGDLVSIPYDVHVGMVVDRNDDKLVCVHSSSSGGGTSIDIIEASTGKNLTNTDNPNINENGQYFTHVTYMDEYYNSH